ncbi:MAG: hypothetical protein KC484_02195 [Colwelliaceae bacterium]|nr:hypothetical protein [Colwelliaceae bacterium]
MTINDEILAIANQLANQGKKPTVALIKTKIAKQVPLPQIISVLKTWQHDPEFIEITSSNELIANKITSRDNEISTLINQEIQPLKDEIQALKLLIKQLIDKH